jgi:hypothetical protein
MIAEADMNDKQRELFELMSDISEDCYCAVWMMGLEYAIWGALQHGDRRYGRGEMDAEKLERCRALANELDGWVIWHDGGSVGAWAESRLMQGPQFVPMTDWLKMAAATILSP